MEDERDRSPDDAVSNRSDDTALEVEQAPAEESVGAPGPGDEAARLAGPEGVTPQAEEEAESSEVATAPISDERETAVRDVSAESSEAKAPAASAQQSPAPVAAAKTEEVPDQEVTMDWYILKVQSNRERSIAEALERKMKIEGLDRYFDQVIVPTEKVTEFKGGKKKVVERKLYPGYIVVHMHINDDTWFAVRETSGVGDFTGASGKPTPMLPHEVARIVQTEEEETKEAPKLDIRFTTGDKVKVKEGNFESFEGEVATIDEASGRVTVMINIFGRSTPVELEYWQIEAV